MPKLVHSVPKYCKHKKTGQAYVTLGGKMVYLGVHGSPESKAEYDRIIREWLGSGRSPTATQISGTITIVELIDRFLTHAEAYYRKDGKSTGSKERFQLSFKPLFKLYGRKLVTEFGPSSLKTVRNVWVEKGLSRTTINTRTQCIKQLFSWGTENELVPVTVSQALRMVRGLQKGRSAVKEGKGVRSVAEEVIEKTLARCSKMIRDMVLVQWLTSIRPNEIVRLKASDIDRSDDVWVCRPDSHKTQHHNKCRQIVIGPKAQAILAPYLLKHSSDEYLFSPREAVKERLDELRLNRKSKVQPSQISRRTANPKVKPGKRYLVGSYRHAIHRACERAGVELWSPNQLRHSMGTLIRRDFGLDAAQAILGHSNAKVTEIYAELDLEKAKEIIRKIG